MSTSTETPLTLRDILNLLAEHKCPDYRLKTADVISGLGHDLDKTLFTTYLEQIDNDPLMWFQSFPSSMSSESALAKPKSALFNLLEKCPRVRSEIGATRCAALVDKVSTVWRANKATLAATRQRLKADMQETRSCASTELTDGAAADSAAAPSKPKPTKETKSLVDKLATLESQKLELVDALQEAQAAYEALQAEHVALCDKTRVLEQQHAQSAVDVNNLKSKLNDLKDILVDVVKNKGGSDIEVMLITRLLPTW